MKYTELTSVLSVVGYQVVTCLHWAALGSFSSLEYPVISDSLGMPPSLTSSPISVKDIRCAMNIIRTYTIQAPVRVLLDVL